MSERALTAPADTALTDGDFDPADLADLRAAVERLRRSRGVIVRGRTCSRACSGRRRRSACGNCASPPA